MPLLARSSESALSRISNKTILNQYLDEWCPDADDPTYIDSVPGEANLYWISYMYLGTAGFFACIVSARDSRITFWTPDRGPVKTCL